MALMGASEHDGVALHPFTGCSAWCIAGVLSLGLVLCVFHRSQTSSVVQVSVPKTPVVIDASGPPSVYAREQQMSSVQLMARWNPIIDKAAKRFHIPAAWLRAVMRQESGGRTMLGEGREMISSRGAVGLMQLMPDTYAEMRAQYHLGADPFDPHDNIFAAAGYLRWLHAKYGFPAMFAAYNGGPGRLEDRLHHARPLPAETRTYVANITHTLGRGAQWLQKTRMVTFTRPNGTRVALDPHKIRGVRVPQPGEYGPHVATVIDLGKKQQAVRENAATVLAAMGMGPRMAGNG